MKRKLVEYKMKFILGVVLLVLLVLVARLSFLQLVQTEEFRTLARNNYIRIVPVFAPRGEIFDRDGKKVVTNRPIYTVSINDLNLQGTTYHLYLDHYGKDNLTIVDKIAWILAEDEESVFYFEEISGQKLQGGEDNNTVNHAQKKMFIEKVIKERIKNNQVKLENGEPVEIAVAYNPSTVAALSKQDLGSFGVRMEKKEDVLSQLVKTLDEAQVFKDESTYEVELRVRDSIRAKKYYRPYEPVLVAEDIPPQVVVALREKQMDLPGIVVDIQPARDYPYESLLSHVLGYVQNINQEQYERYKDEGYMMNDLFGQNGLEKVFEKSLRGEHGARQVEVDASSRPVRDLGLKQPVPGNDLVLTIDLELQTAAEKALADGVERAQKNGYHYSKGGAAVVMDVNTGAVLAMASYPDYNPGLFESGLSQAKYDELQESKALMNRALTGVYPPGSTFKMITSAAILENNIVDPEYKMLDPGYFMLGKSRFNDWKPGGHGRVDLRKALEESVDTYFYKYGLQVGVEAIAHYADEFGLGKKTGISLPGEMSGAVPTPQYKYEKEKTFIIWSKPEFARVRELNQQIEEAENQSQKLKLRQQRDQELEKLLKKYEWDLNWHAYDTVNMSIGQGYNQYTPIQLVGYIAAIANGGKLYKPILVDKIVSPNGQTIKKYTPEVSHRVDIKPENLQIIREGMHMVTLPPNGTAAGVFNGAKYSAAAKTGTAENEKGEGQGHALFVSYAPYEKPEVAVAVVLEYGHAGSGYAGPIAREILDAYFNDMAVIKDNAEQKGSTSDNEEDAVTTGTNGAFNWDIAHSLIWPGFEPPSLSETSNQSEVSVQPGQTPRNKVTSAPPPDNQQPVQQVAPEAPQQQPTELPREQPELPQEQPNTGQPPQESAPPEQQSPQTQPTEPEQGEQSQQTDLGTPDDNPPNGSANP